MTKLRSPGIPADPYAPYWWEQLPTDPKSRFRLMYSLGRFYGELPTLPGVGDSKIDFSAWKVLYSRISLADRLETRS